MNLLLQQETLAAELDFLGPLLPSGVDECLRWLTFEVVGDEFRARAASPFAAHESRLPLTEFHSAGRFKIATPVTRQLIALLPSAPLTFAVTASNTLEMAWPDGKALFRTSAAPAAGPELYDREILSRHLVPSTALREAFEGTRVSWLDDANVHVPGVLVLLGEQLRVVATDGTSLSVCGVDTPGCPPGTYIINKLACEHILKLTSSLAGPALVEFGEKHVRVAVGHRTIIAPVVAAKFLPWERFLVTQPRIQIDFPRASISAAIRRACVLNDESVRIGLRIRPGELDVVSGASTESVPIVYEGEPANFTFNGLILGKMFAGFDSERIELLALDATDRVGFRPLGHPHTQCVLMPMRNID